MSRYEVMAMGDRDGWVCVVQRNRDQDGAEFIPSVAEFEERYACLAQEMADRLNVRELAQSGRIPERGFGETSGY